LRITSFHEFEAATSFALSPGCPQHAFFSRLGCFGRHHMHIHKRSRFLPLSIGQKA
jgi:hypothetical protein